MVESGEHHGRSYVLRCRGSQLPLLGRYCTASATWALIDALRNRAIAGAALDVYDIEPLPESHPFRSLDNVLATPHIGFVTEGAYQAFYSHTVENITAWLDGAPIRVIC
jgi:phosphoglycerate dehydrogenase-like enzyme